VTKQEFEGLKARGYDERLAFLVAAVDGAFRNRVGTGYDPVEAYARSVGEIAKLNALAEGYSPDEASDRERAVYEKTLREGLDDPDRPHAQRIFPTSQRDEERRG
jgi:hypothetical protein